MVYGDKANAIDNWRTHIVRMDTTCDAWEQMEANNPHPKTNNTSNGEAHRKPQRRSHRQAHSDSNEMAHRASNGVAHCDAHY